MTQRRLRSRGGFPTKRDAREARTEALGKLDAGRDPFPSDMSVGELATCWLEHKRSGAGRRVRSTTLKRYAGLLDTDLLPVLGHLRVGKLRPAHVQEALDGMAARGLAARTITQARAVMNGIGRWAVAQGVIEVNPVAATEAPQADDPETYTPRSEEVLALLSEAAGDETWHVPVLLAATAGMRRSETLGVCWSDVDLEAGQLRVSRSLQRDPDTGELVFFDVKSHRSRRPVPLPRIAVEALREHKRAQNERRLKLGAGWQDFDLVCERGDGGPLDPDAFTHAAKRLYARVGLPPETRLHDLRHAVGTALAEATGGDAALIRDTLGHARSAFTMDTYCRNTQTAERARDALDQAFEGARSADG